MEPITLIIVSVIISILLMAGLAGFMAWYYLRRQTPETTYQALDEPLDPTYAQSLEELLKPHIPAPIENTHLVTHDCCAEISATADLNDPTVKNNLIKQTAEKIFNNFKEADIKNDWFSLEQIIDMMRNVFLGIVSPKLLSQPVETKIGDETSGRMLRIESSGGLLEGDKIVWRLHTTLTGVGIPSSSQPTNSTDEPLISNLTLSTF